MFKKLKDKIAEEVKISPQRIQQFTQSVTDKLQSNGNDDNVFSITDDDMPHTPQTVTEAGFTNVSLYASGSNESRIRRSSNSSMASDVSFLPRYEPSVNTYHLQSDLDISASELEDNASTSSQLGHVSKEQVYSAFQKAQMRYHKYRGRYTDLANHYKELEREISKMKAVLVETQDKAIRRTSELREQCSLSQKAKADLEQALRTEIEEKQIIISTLQDKVNLLQNNEKLAETHDNAELESLKGRMQEMKANAIISHTKDAECKERIASLEKTLAEVEERERSNNLKFAKSKMELHTEIEDKETEISNLKKDVETVRKELEVAEGKQGQNLKAQNAKLIEKCETLSSKCQNYEGELLKVEQYKLEIAGLQKERSEARKRFEETTQQLGNVDKLFAEIEGYKNKLQKYESGNEDCNKMMEELSKNKAKIEESEREIEELKSALAKRDEGFETRLQEFDLERKTFEGYKKQLNDFELENTKLRSKLSENLEGYKRKFEELSKNIEELEGYKWKCKELEAENLEVSKNIEEYKRKLKEKVDEIEGFKRVCNESNSKLAKLVKEIEDGEQSRKEIEVENERLTQNYESKCEEFDLQQTKLTKYEESLQELHSKNEEANLKLKQSEEDGLKLQAKTKQSLLNLESKIRETIQADYMKKEKDLKLDFEKKLDDLRANDEDTKQTQIKLMRSVEKVEQLGAAVTQLRTELEARINAYAELESNHLGLIEENNGRQVETFELKKQIQKKIDEISALQQELRCKNEEIAKIVVHEEEGMSALHEEIRCNNEDISVLLQEVSVLKQELECKNGEISSLKHENVDIKQGIESKNEEISVLKQEVTAQEQKIKDKNEEYNKLAQSLQETTNAVSILTEELKMSAAKKKNLERGLVETGEKLRELQESNVVSVLTEELKNLERKLEVETEENSALKKEIREKTAAIEEFETKVGEVSFLNEELTVKTAEISALKQEIEFKTKEIERIQELQSKTEEEITALKEEIKEYSKLKQKLKSKSEENKKLAQKVKDKTEENERMKINFEERASLQQDNEFLRVNITELSNRCRGLQTDLEKMSADLSSEKELNAELERRALRGENEVSELLDQNNQKIDENVELMQKLQSALKQNEVQNTHLTSLKEEFLRMSANEEKLKEQIEEYNSAREENESLQAELLKLRGELANLTSSQHDFKVNLDENQNFKDEIARLGGELSSSREKYSEMLNENTRLGTELKLLNDELVNLDFYKEENSKLSEESTKLRTALDATSSEKQRLHDQCERFKLIQNQYNDLLNSNESSGNRLTTLEAEISKLHVRNSEISADNQNLIKENDHLLTECMELKAKYENFDVHKIQLNEKITHLAGDNENAMGEIERLTDANKTLREQLNKLIENAPESDDLHGKISDLHAKYEQVSLENENFKKQLSESRGRLDSITADRKRLETQFYDLEKHCGELVHEKQLLRDEIEELKISPLNLAQNGNREVENLRDKLAQYKSIDATNRSSIEFYENELQKMRNKNEKLNRKLDETLVTLNHCADLSSSTEIEYLKNILYNYMLGKESMVMARVLAAVCKFDSQQTEEVLKHEQHKQTLFGQLGIL